MLTVHNKQPNYSWNHALNLVVCSRIAMNKVEVQGHEMAAVRILYIQ